MHARIKASPDLAYEAIAGLTRRGTCDFDLVTKTKTVSRLVAEANDHTLEQLVSMYDEILRDSGDLDPKALESRRRSIAGQLVMILRSKSADEHLAPWVDSLLNVLATFAYLPLDTAAAPEISSTSRTMFRGRLSTSFAHLLASKDARKHDRPYRVLRFMKEQDGLVNEALMSKQIVKEVRSAMKRLSSLDKLVGHA